MKVMGIGPSSREKLSLVLSGSNGIITPARTAEILNVSIQEAGRLLSRWGNGHWLKRIKRGVYVPVDLKDPQGAASTEDPWKVAQKIFAPGYIGGFSAVKHWDYSEQIIETITFLTEKKVKQRDLFLGDQRIKLKTISPYKNFAVIIVWQDNLKIFISDKSKTIIDILDDPKLVGGMQMVKDIFLEYFDSKDYTFNTLLEYAVKMKNKTIFKRLGFLMETLKIANSSELSLIKGHISSGYSSFDPCVKNKHVISSWNLIVPASWKAEYDREK